MMGSKRILITLFLINSCLSAWTREVTDTLESSKRDRVIITYNVTQTDGRVAVQFLDVRKILGRTYRDKYKKLDEVAVLFFDRIGNYEDNMRFTGMNVKAFIVPSEISYNFSEDGYFLLKDNPKLTFDLHTTEPVELSIPLFLAHYERKHRYEVFSRCEDLKIRLLKKGISNDASRQLTTQTITSQEELNEPDADMVVANSLINRINVLMAEQEDYPFSDELKQAISSLCEISYRPIDNDLSEKIGEVLSACSLKEKELKEAAKATEDAAARSAELQAKRAEMQAKARQDSIAAAAQQKAEEDRKNQLWLVIGGVILAVLAFIGNQLFQHFRNVQNQKNIMDMQQEAVKRAKDESKRRARNMAQSQMNQTESEAKRKIRSTINEGISKTAKKGKNNKGISI